MISYQEIKGNKIGIVIEEDAITRLLFNKTSDHYIEKETKWHRLAFKELREYFNGERKVFTVPLNPAGTKFQKQVWNALLEIPYGQTASYQDIAVLINNQKAVRAVGNANGKNPIPIIIPCHRVIQKDGSLGGYTGGVDIKKTLLDLERDNSDD